MIYAHVEATGFSLSAFSLQVIYAQRRNLGQGFGAFCMLMLLSEECDLTNGKGEPL